MYEASLNDINAEHKLYEEILNVSTFLTSILSCVHALK
jgi:hypothetical protein